MALLAGRSVGLAYSTRVAIRRACDLLGLRPGDEVLAPAYNCGSELDPLLQAGLTVRLFPVAADTTIDVEAIRAMIGPRTRAIYLIHYFGVLHPQGAALRDLCDRLGLALIEDCALSLLSGDPATRGRLGDVALFCFYKFFPLLAGGALVLNRPLPGGAELTFPRPAPKAEERRHLLRAGLLQVPGVAGALRRRRARRGGAEPTGEAFPDMPASYYFDPDLADRGISAWDRRAMAGINVAAASRARRAHYADYLARLTALPEVWPLFPALPDGTVPLAMPVLVADRDRIAAALQAEGIAAVPWWAGYHRGLDFAGQAGARALKDGVLALPVHQDLGPGAVAHIIAALARRVRSGSSGPTDDRGPPRPAA